MIANSFPGRGNPAPERRRLAHEEQRVEHDRFSEGDGQDRLDHDLRRGAGIPPDGHGCPLPDQPDADRRAQSCQADVQTSGHRYVLSVSFQPCACTPGSSWCWQISRVKTAVSNMNTIAWTSPTSSSMK